MCLDSLNNIEKSTQGKDTAAIIQSKVLQVHVSCLVDYNVQDSDRLSNIKIINVFHET